MCILGGSQERLPEEVVYGLSLNGRINNFLEGRSRYPGFWQCVREIVGDPTGLEVRMFRKG